MLLASSEKDLKRKFCQDFACEGFSDVGLNKTSVRPDKSPFMYLPTSIATEAKNDTYDLMMRHEQTR